MLPKIALPPGIASAEEGASGLLHISYSRDGMAYPQDIHPANLDALTDYLVALREAKANRWRVESQAGGAWWVVIAGVRPPLRHAATFFDGDPDPKAAAEAYAETLNKAEGLSA